MAKEVDVWALTEFGKPLERIRQPMPQPTGTEILIEVTHCGVCHSDLHFWEGEYDLGGGKKFYVKDRGVKLPVAMGHEILGNIVKVGPDAEGDLPAGGRRIIYPWVGCLNCRRCSENEDNMCAAQTSLGIVRNGGFASHVIVPHPRYLADPGDLNPSVACTFGCSGITTLNAVNKVLPMNPDDAIFLIGAGGVGLAAIAMLKAKGHKKIVSIDIDDEKLEAAKKAGATIVINSAKVDPAQAIKDAAGGFVLGVIDFVNNSKTAAMVNGLLSKGATWVQVGVMGGSVELSLVSMIFRGITIKANITGNPANLQEVTKLGREGKLPAVPVTEMPWDEVNQAMDLLRDGKVTGRIILVR